MLEWAVLLLVLEVAWWVGVILIVRAVRSLWTAIADIPISY